MANDKRDDFRPEWKTDKTFEEGDVIVLVHKSNHRTPYYRIELCFKGRQGPVRSLSPHFERSNGKITTTKVADVVRRLWADAEGYTADMMQVAEDEWIERQTNSGKRDNKTPKGLKTLAKMDKAKREAANKEPTKTE